MTVKFRKVNDQRPFADGSHILYVNGAYKGNDPLGKLMQDMNNQGTEGFNYEVLKDGIRHFKMDKEEHDNMTDSIEEFAREVADDRETEIIAKILRKGKDAEEVADLLDMEKKDKAWDICPGSDVQYRMTLEYLAKLCMVLHEKYNDELVYIYD